MGSHFEKFPGRVVRGGAGEVGKLVGGVFRHRDFYRRALEGGETDVTVGVDRDVLAAKKDELMRRVRVMTGNVKPRRSLRCVWYAAAVILPLAIAVGMWVNMGGREKNMVIAQRVQPGSGRAVLELHDGRTYFLDTTRVVETGIEGNLAKAEKQSLVYTKRRPRSWCIIK